MLLTWARIAMVPLVVGVFYLPDAWIAPSVKNITACTLFTLAAITDASTDSWRADTVKPASWVRFWTRWRTS